MKYFPLHILCVSSQIVFLVLAEGIRFKANKNLTWYVHSKSHLSNWQGLSVL